MIAKRDHRAQQIPHSHMGKCCSMMTLTLTPSRTFSTPKLLEQSSPSLHASAMPYFSG
jgi:hypothetical protein